MPPTMIDPFLLRMLSSTSTFQPFCHVDGDGGAGGGSDLGAGGGGSPDGGSGDGAGDNKPTGPDWEAFIRGMDGLNQNLGGKFDALLNEVRTSRPQPPADPEPEPSDLDAMTNSELFAHMMGKMTKAFEGMLDGKLGPVVGHINNLTTTMTTDSVTREMNTLKESAKDFQDWNTEMIDLAKEHPSLGVKDLYHLARSRNPAKTEELTKKYAPPPPKKPNAFGGLGPAPNGKGGTSPVLSALEAGREAYREVSERHPGVFAPLQE